MLAKLNVLKNKYKLLISKSNKNLTTGNYIFIAKVLFALKKKCYI